MCHHAWLGLPFKKFEFSSTIPTSFHAHFTELGVLETFQVRQYHMVLAFKNSSSLFFSPALKDVPVF